jgi:hypothetical protein
VIIYVPSYLDICGHTEWRRIFSEIGRKWNIFKSDFPYNMGKSGETHYNLFIGLKLLLFSFKNRKKDFYMTGCELYCIINNFTLKLY